MAKDGTKRGRPKGSKGKSTIEKEVARELLRQQVLAKLGPMVERQIEHAMGIKFMMVRNVKGGKWTRVTADMADKGFDTDTETVEVFEKDPSIQAFTDLANRAIDKPKETTENTHHLPGVEGLLERLLAARKRVNG